ncbi:MAG: hypothetical protein NTX86_02995 [Candidatus Dependentiae bacterium]|nr:hypothetical protein [Candidatus Dependentiae bacterium]
MHTSWLVLLPTCIVLISTFITGSLNWSLAIGIATGAFIAADFNLPQTINIAGTRLLGTISDYDNLYLYAFLFIISIIIVLLNHTGGALAFAHILTKRLRSKRAAETTSLLISLALFIDDYLSSLTVGYVMRPITDRLHIPRVKLAYLVRAMTGPLVILAPISSWVGILITSLDSAGIAPQGTSGAKIIGDPLFIYLQTIPYMFYSFLIIASAWFIVYYGISFGPMHTQEAIASTTDNLFGGKQPITDTLNIEASSHGSAIDLLLPIITLISTVFLGCLWQGDYHLFGGTRTALEAFKHVNNMFLVLFIASLITLTITITFAFLRKTTSPKALLQCTKEGIVMMLGAVIMVMLANTLSSLLRFDLATGQYLATLLQGVLHLPILPFMFFILSAVTATLLGVSLGTTMILIPIAIPMLTALTGIPLPTTPEELTYLLPVIAAVFSGSVCGNHISPIADTTAMVATSSGCYPLDHTRTQLPYIVPAIVGSALAFLLSGLCAPYSLIWRIFVPLASGMTLCFVLLYSMHILNKRK